MGFHHLGSPSKPETSRCTLVEAGFKGQLIFSGGHEYRGKHLFLALEMLRQRLPEFSTISVS
jgi:hypothetical protein